MKLAWMQRIPSLVQEEDITTKKLNTYVWFGPRFACKTSFYVGLQFSMRSEGQSKSMVGIVRSYIQGILTTVLRNHRGYYIRGYDLTKLLKTVLK